MMSLNLDDYSLVDLSINEQENLDGGSFAKDLGFAVGFAVGFTVGGGLVLLALGAKQILT